MIKIQHLSIIFVIIMLPISLIISAYTQKQIDTLIVQQQYNSRLMDATYDAIKAFDMNTTLENNSNVTDTLRDDIKAAINTFMSSFASSMGAPGAAERYVRPYVPAVLFTLYDGYYIYSPTLKKDGSGYEYTLQPYNYYSVRYKDGRNDVVINYTLDNYIAVYGWIEGEYYVKSGYLISDNNPGISNHETSEKITENVPIAVLNGSSITNIEVRPGIDVTDEKYSKPVKLSDSGTAEFMYEDNSLYYIKPNSADLYYKNRDDKDIPDDSEEETETFTSWVNNNLAWIRPSCAFRNGNQINVLKDDTTTKIFPIDSNNDPEDVESNFNTHRIDIISNTIQDNLNFVITAYADSAGANQDTKYNFRLPQIDTNEWIRIASNVCFVPFVQGIPMGTKYFNSYCVVQSTTNKFHVIPENIYYIDGGDYYHRIDCPHLSEGNITGFSSYKFQEFQLRKRDGSNEVSYYYLRSEKPCYYCIVGSYNSEYRNDEGELSIEKLAGSPSRLTAYYTALGREKYNQYATTNYFGTQKYAGADDIDEEEID